MRIARWRAMGSTCGGSESMSSRKRRKRGRRRSGREKGGSECACSRCGQTLKRLGQLADVVGIAYSIESDGGRVAEASPLTLRHSPRFRHNSRFTRPVSRSPQPSFAFFLFLPSLSRPPLPPPPGHPQRRRPQPHELPLLPLPPVRCLGLSPHATQHPRLRVRPIASRRRAPHKAQEVRLH